MFGFVVDGAARYAKGVRAEFTEERQRLELRLQAADDPADKVEILGQIAAAERKMQAALDAVHPSCLF